MVWPPEYPEHVLERHPVAHTEWHRDMRDADFDDPQWIDPAFPHHRDVPKLTRAVRPILDAARRIHGGADLAAALLQSPGAPLGARVNLSHGPGGCVARFCRIPAECLKNTCSTRAEVSRRNCG